MKRVSAKRGNNLLTTFVDGYAFGWFMAVKECFREQLDIRYTDRIASLAAPDGKKTKRAVSEWTQGRCYSFATEHILYDTRKAYLPWNEALQHINIACKITSAVPNELIRIESEETPGYFLQEGRVDFIISIPNLERSALVEVGKYRLSQNQFVEFLQTGRYIIDEQRTMP